MVLAKMLGVYFIVNGNIYLAPDVYNIVASHLVTNLPMPANPTELML